jgi:hypothetical protein
MNSISEQRSDRIDFTQADLSRSPSVNSTMEQPPNRLVHDRAWHRDGARDSLDTSGMGAIRRYALGATLVAGACVAPLAVAAALHPMPIVWTSLRFDDERVVRHELAGREPEAQPGAGRVEMEFLAQYPQQRAQFVDFRPGYRQGRRIGHRAGAGHAADRYVPAPARLVRPSR